MDIIKRITSASKLAPPLYTIKPGDNLSLIAKLNNTTLQNILGLNPDIKNPNLIKPGLSIKVQAEPKAKVVRPSSYIIKPGDNLSTIAKQYDTTLQDVLRDNPDIKNPNLIKPGLNIKLPEVGPRLRSFKEIEGIEAELNKRSNEELIHHHYIKNDINGNYIIDDKKNNLTAVYNKGRLVKKWSSIHGKNSESDDLTTTETDARGNLIEKAGNMSTPAGFYLSRYSRKYHGAPSYVRYQPWMVEKNYVDGIPSSIHARTIRENANTNGCTGMACLALKEMDKIVGRNKYIDTYILPVEKGNRFHIRNGVVQFKSNDTDLTPAHNTIVKTPIKKFEYKLPEGATKELYETVKKYTDSLIQNKESLLNDLGLNNDTYIKLSKLAYGILGTESTFGNRNSAIGNLARAANKARAKKFGGTASSPDIYSKYDTYGANEDYRSVGLTLMRMNVVTKNEKAKTLLEKYEITKDDLVHNPAKAAVATLIHLSTLYKEAKEDLDETVARWNGAKGYTPKVKKYVDMIEAYLMYRKGGKLNDNIRLIAKR